MRPQLPTLPKALKLDPHLETLPPLQPRRVGAERERRQRVQRRPPQVPHAQRHEDHARERGKHGQEHRRGGSRRGAFRGPLHDHVHPRRRHEAPVRHRHSQAVLAGHVRHEAGDVAGVIREEHSRARVPGAGRGAVGEDGAGVAPGSKRLVPQHEHLIAVRIARVALNLLPREAQSDVFRRGQRARDRRGVALERRVELERPLVAHVAHVELEPVRADDVGVKRGEKIPGILHDGEEAVLGRDGVEVGETVRVRAFRRLGLVPVTKVPTPRVAPVRRPLQRPTVHETVGGVKRGVPNGRVRPLLPFLPEPQRGVGRRRRRGRRGGAVVHDRHLRRARSTRGGSVEYRSRRHQRVHRLFVVVVVLLADVGEERRGSVQPQRRPPPHGVRLRRVLHRLSLSPVHHPGRLVAHARHGLVRAKRRHVAHRLRGDVTRVQDGDEDHVGTGKVGLQHRADVPRGGHGGQDVVNVRRGRSVDPRVGRRRLAHLGRVARHRRQHSKHPRIDRALLVREVQVLGGHLGPDRGEDHFEIHDELLRAGRREPGAEILVGEVEDAERHVTPRPPGGQEEETVRHGLHRGVGSEEEVALLLALREPRDGDELLGGARLHLLDGQRRGWRGRGVGIRDVPTRGWRRRERRLTCDARQRRDRDEDDEP